MLNPRHHLLNLQFPLSNLTGEIHQGRVPHQRFTLQGGIHLSDHTIQLRSLHHHRRQPPNLPVPDGNQTSTTICLLPAPVILLPNLTPSPTSFFSDVVLVSGDRCISTKRCHPPIGFPVTGTTIDSTSGGDPIQLHLLPRWFPSSAKLTSPTTVRFSGDRTPHHHMVALQCI